MVGLLDHAMVMGIASPLAKTCWLRDPDKVESQANGDEEHRARIGTTDMFEMAGKPQTGWEANSLGWEANNRLGSQQIGWEANKNYGKISEVSLRYCTALS